jgi:hypothetical protein
MPGSRIWWSFNKIIPGWNNFTGCFWFVCPVIVEPGQQLQFIIAMLAAYAGGFILTWFFGVEEDKIDNIFGE